MLRKLLTKIDNGQNYIVDGEEVREVTLDNIYRIYVENLDPIGYDYNGSYYSCKMEDMIDKETAERTAAENKERNIAERVAYLKERMNGIMEELKELLQC